MGEVAAKRIIALAAIALLSACIPRGGEDYSVQSSGNVAGEKTATGNPVVLVPEARILEPTPSWNPATVTRNAQTVDASVHIVRPGDTLYRIGNQTGAGAEAIAKANGLTAPFALQAGQKLRIPAGQFHKVAAGETGIAIARAYGVAWSDLVALNALTAPFVLRSGQFLSLPYVGEIDAQAMADAFVLDIDTIATGSQPAKADPGRAGSTLSTPIAIPSSFAGAFGWPLLGKVVSRFGSKGGGQVNDGLNIAAVLGTNVAAAGDGVVVYAGNEIAVFGGLVMIDHGDGWMTAYGHLGKLAVKRGTKVKRGHLLGNVGDTGYVSTPQLHFEIRKDRMPVDPLTKLPAR